VRLSSICEASAGLLLYVKKSGTVQVAPCGIRMTFAGAMSNIRQCKLLPRADQMGLEGGLVRPYVFKDGGARPLL